ncbi:MAG: hypothetical protein E7486_04455 [Ruminococcaceae bacterium]|nr:hypothetical protein [Oscillospiraceae bacterium]
MMVKGVNKRIIEVSRAENPVFERAILFIRPEFAQMEDADIRRQGEIYVRELCRELPLPQTYSKKKKRGTILVPALCALCGAAGASGVLLLLGAAGQI